MDKSFGIKIPKKERENKTNSSSRSCGGKLRIVLLACSVAHNDAEQDVT